MSGKNTVYSTDQGKHCSRCSKPQAQCQCKSRTRSASSGLQSSAKVSDGIVRLHRQSKGRAGKPVTLITGLDIKMEELKKLAKTIKTKCGVGGKIEGHDILLQGDKRAMIKIELESLGYTVKIAGG
ncbi:MAG: stress response translation initiation inhibitor YciH [Pseudomonadales bacterium]|nr:stress response translation initiation inhibitor YciH [Pseudomonadales bacterium]